MRQHLTDPGTSMSTILAGLWEALGGEAQWLTHVEQTGTGELPSVFAVSDLASASVAAAGLATAELIDKGFNSVPDVRVDRRLSSLWFASSLKPQGWSLPSAWDAIAGDYAASNGWIRLHTNAPHHRDAALAVLGVPAERDAVATVVARWRADDLETAIVEKGGCAATMRTVAEWADHPQGRAVSREPLLRFESYDIAARRVVVGSRQRPLAGVKVLDLTRVLAGPVATRFLAGLGAEVLRLDPPWWDEPGVLPDVTLGKRCARLDLGDARQRAQFLALLAEADVLVHGYRPDALDRLDLGAATRQRTSPGLIDVSLDAYGWTGPWRNRRGFDSLVQMSAGIAAEGMRRYGTDKPKPLPVQAIDHATGYLLAGAALRGLTRRMTSGCGSRWCASLARTAMLLTSLPASVASSGMMAVEATDFEDRLEQTDWGPAWRLKPPLALTDTIIGWDCPAGNLGSAQPQWQS